MGILDTMTDFISEGISRIKTPIMTVPAVLLSVSAINRPGMSAMEIASNIIRRQSEAGAPCGPNSDGSANIAEAMERIRVEEIIRALKMDSRVQIAIPKGGIQFMGTGTSGAGIPVSVTGFNVNDVHGDGIIG